MMIPLAAVLCALRFAPASRAAVAATFPAAAAAAGVSPAAAGDDGCAVSQELRGGTLTFRSRSGYATIKKRLRSETMKDIAPDEVLDRRAILRW